MRELRKSPCLRVSIKYSVICATLGLAMALLLVYLILGVDAISREIFRDSSIIAIVMFYAAAFILGLVAGGLIYRRSSWSENLVNRHWASVGVFIDFGHCRFVNELF